MKIGIHIVAAFLILNVGAAKCLQATPSDTLVVEVKGTGADAQFVPAVVQVNLGDVIRFEVLEGMHTITAYHPENRRPLRIPESASSFDSGLLKEGARWLLKIEEEGVYDYFCLPHERLGHAGRIIAGTNTPNPYDDSLIPIAVVETLTRHDINIQQNRK
jgi:plastocyanin